MVGRPDLASARAKLEWGNHHFKTISDEIREWGQPDSDTIITDDWEEHPDQGYTLVRVTSVGPIPSHWRFVIGDAISNYRSALNYAAFDIVPAKATLPPDKLGKIQFPIVDPGKYPAAATFTVGRFHPEHLPGVPLKYWRALSPFQPYRGRLNSRWPLDALYVASSPRINRQNKSVVILTFVPLPGSKSPEAGTKFVRLNWAPDFHPIRARDWNAAVSDYADVGVDLKCEVSVAFEDYGAREVLSTLERISQVTGQILEAIERV